MESKPVEVIIADDHVVVRTGLHLIFQEEGIQIKAEVNNGNDLLKILGQKRFDVAIVDLNMPGKDSISLLLEVRKQHPSLPIVIFTMSQDENLASRLMQFGISAYINKEDDSQEIVRAVKSAAKGEVYLTPRQKNFFSMQYVKGYDHNIPHDRLTDREYQIMCLMAKGKSNDEIAQKLLISKNTFSNHRNNILRKMKFSNIAELTTYAIKNHLIE